MAPRSRQMCIVSQLIGAHKHTHTVMATKLAIRKFAKKRSNSRHVGWVSLGLVQKLRRMNRVVFAVSSNTDDTEASCWLSDNFYNAIGHSCLGVRC